MANFAIQLKAVTGRCPVQKTGGRYEFCLYCEVGSKTAGIKNPQRRGRGQGSKNELRPMLRFYITGGQVDNTHTAKVNGARDSQLDSLNVGGMFEAWF